MNTQVRSSIREWVALTLAALFMGLALLAPVRSLLPAATGASIPQWDKIAPVAEEHEPGFG